MQIILGTFTAEIMFACRPDSLLCSLVTDTADENILTTLTILLQDEIRVIRNLTHLHNETEDIGIVVEKNTLSDIGLKLSSTAVHNTTSKVILFLTKELTIDVDFLCWQLHSGRVVTLDTAKHKAISQDSKLLEGLCSWTFVAKLLNGIEQLLIEDRDVLHATVIAACAAIVLIHLPIQFRA
jgi:hypothetical protein